MIAEFCRFRFHGNLNDFLPVTQRDQWIDYRLDGTVAVKHCIEALGVPHPEVEQITVDNRSVAFTHHLGAGEEVRVYPRGCCGLLAHRMPLRPPLTRPVRFVLDTHLGRLAAYLRMLGFDANYQNDYDDAALAAIAQAQNRVLLTRDRGLLKRKVVVYGYCIRHSEPRAQLVELLERYHLVAEACPWTRCVRCNGLLTTVDKADILELLEPKTKLYYDEFQRCVACGQIYWRGSHHERMRDFLAAAMRAATASQTNSEFSPEPSLDED